DARHHLALAVDDGGDFLFEGSFGDQLEDLDGALLADAVDAVGGLVFARGVPPAGVVDDDGAADEVDAGSSGFQAAEEDAAGGVAVEAVHELAAVGAGTGEGDVVDADPLELALHEGDHAQELGEDDDFLPAFERLLEELLIEIPLAGGVLLDAVEIAERQDRMVADLLEEVEQGEDVDVRQRLVRLFERLRQLGAFSFNGVAVELHLIVRQWAGAHVFDLRWQLVEDAGLQAAEDERRDHPAQLGHFAGRGSTEADVARHAGDTEALLEGVVGAEVAREDEVEQGLQVAERILDRRAGEADPHLGDQVRGGLPGLGLPVLDLLDLVEHGEAEGDRRQLLGVAAQHAIGSDHHVLRPQAERQLALRTVIDDRIQAGGMLVELVAPVADHAGGAGDEKRLAAAFF